MVFRTACSGFPSYLQLTLAAIFTLWVTGLGKFDVLYNFTQRMKLTRGQYGYYTGKLHTLCLEIHSYVLHTVCYIGVVSIDNNNNNNNNNTALS